MHQTTALVFPADSPFMPDFCDITAITLPKIGKKGNLSLAKEWKGGEGHRGKLPPPGRSVSDVGQFFECPQPYYFTQPLD
jgi:hypothetical protein